MTTDDIRRIEESLRISLPESYRDRMVPFPVPAAAGNTDLAVWDSPDHLIDFNRELRRGAPGGVKPWPARFFAIGHPGDGSPYALDLQDGDAVWWVDHSHLDNPGSNKEAESFSEWADDYFSTLREEMAGEEVDPDSSPVDRAAVEAKNAKANTMACLVVAVLLAALVGVVIWVVSR